MTVNIMPCWTLRMIRGRRQGRGAQAVIGRAQGTSAQALVAKCHGGTSGERGSRCRGLGEGYRRRLGRVLVQEAPWSR